MREISAIEIAAVVGELRALAGGHMDKLYELGPGRFRIAVRHGEGKVNISCVLGLTLNITSYLERPEQPTGFAAAFRKLSAGAVIERVEQLDHDRIVDIAVRRAAGVMHVVIEMFGGGNMVVTDGDMRILLAYKSRDYGSRSIRAGSVYTPPGNGQTWIGGSGQAAAEELVVDALAKARQGSKAMPALFAAFGMGTAYIEEALAEAEVDPGADPKALGNEAVKRLAAALLGMARLPEKPRPMIFWEHGRAVDYALRALAKYSKTETQRFEAASTMLDAFYGENRAEGAAPDEEGAELRASMKKQEELAVGLGPRIGAARSAGRAIFDNMALFNSIIRAARERKRATAEGLRGLFPGVRIKSVDLKEKTITIEV